MKTRLLCMLLLCWLAQWSMAQAPKWVEKAKRSVFSIVTYDDSDKILKTGNGFFVSEDGVALSDYSLFKGAKRAVAITGEGKQMPVEAIMGVDDMYDVAKFRVAIDGKKVQALPLAATAPAVGSKVLLLPYSTQKDRSFTPGELKAADKAGEKYYYYTLGMHLRDKMVSCPVLTEQGQVFGLAQLSSGKDTATVCYAVDVRYAMDRNISALSFTDNALRAIGIKKALPDTEDQALVFLFMVSSQVTPEQYAGLIDDFIAQFPGSSEGYLRRATHNLGLAKDEAALKGVEDDMEQALKIADKKDDVYYNRAKLVYNYALDHPDNTLKDWTFDRALQEIKEAIALDPLPIYVQLEGDIQYARADFAAALACYEQVNRSPMASVTTFLSAAKSKQQLQAPAEEVLALMDSCVARYSKPYTVEAAPYLLERAQMRMSYGQAREAIFDYDAYYDAVGGKVNDVFYYLREQAALQGKQYQRALDDMAKAIELNPQDLTYRAELSVINIRVGRNEEAIRVLEEALKIDPNYAEAYRLMGLAYLQLKKKDEACRCLAKAKELGDPNVDELIKKHCE